MSPASRWNLPRTWHHPGQKIACAVLWEGLADEREKARARQAHGETAPGKTLVETFPQAFDKGKTRDKAAAIYGTTPRYVSDANKLKSEAPELFEEVHKGHLSNGWRVTGAAF